MPPWILAATESTWLVLGSSSDMIKPGKMEQSKQYMPNDGGDVVELR